MKGVWKWEKRERDDTRSFQPCFLTCAEDIAAAESCLLRLRSADWNDRTRTVSVSTRIMATRDFVHDGNQNLVVRFRPVYHLAPPVWSNYTPPELQVRSVLLHLPPPPPPSNTGKIGTPRITGKIGTLRITGKIGTPRITGKIGTPPSPHHPVNYR